MSTGKPEIGSAKKGGVLSSAAVLEVLRVGKTADQDCDKADIVWALRKRGTSLQRVARQNDLARSALMSLSQRPWPKGERLVAEALGLQPQQVWPSRYNADGTRKNGPGERHVIQFPARKHSTRKPALNVHRGRAA